MGISNHAGREIIMNSNIIEVMWEGPFNLEEVIDDYWDEKRDRGVYQVYGPHVLYSLEKKDPNILLYIGKTKKTFSERFTDHKVNFFSDDDLSRLEIYLGRLEDSSKYAGKNNRKIWKDDVGFSEKIMIYKYLPSYNSEHIADSPDLKTYKKIVLKHEGKKGCLHSIDKAPEDFKKDFV